MKLDHIVIHLDRGVSGRDEAEAALVAAGIPFDPRKGKTARGFSTLLVWIGRQYFELVTIASPQNSWQPEWAARYAAGDRGCYCVFFELEHDIDAVWSAMRRAGLAPRAVERTRFRWFFGLFGMRMPWRFFVTDALPGTGIEIGFIQYDPGTREKYAKSCVPNAADLGLIGLGAAQIASRDPQAAEARLAALNAVLGEPLPLRISSGSEPALTVEGTGNFLCDLRIGDVRLRSSGAGGPEC